jgi:hypothetical protein
VELSELVRAYYLRVKDNKAAAVVALMHVEHLYYKHDTIASAVQRAHEFNKTWGKYSDLHPASLGTSCPVLSCRSHVRQPMAVTSPHSTRSAIRRQSDCRHVRD